MGVERVPTPFSTNVRACDVVMSVAGLICVLVVLSDIVELVNVSCIWHATVAVDLK